MRESNHFGVPLLYGTARFLGGLIRVWKMLARPRPLASPGPPAPRGVSVVIPSRDGRDLLARLLPDLKRELAGLPSEIVVVDNGSTDGSIEWLRAGHADVLFEYSASPLAFAEAVNRGLARVRYAHVCLLNNDMVLDAGFFAPLLEAFDRVPDLFAATAQIFFPEGVRREETGKAVMAAAHPDDFPLRCDLPLPGEDLSYVLYASGGCSLYDTAKLRQLGGFDRSYRPAYVEDLDIGFRAWRLGWPTVFVARAGVVHFHRTTTARFYSAEMLDRILEVNYLRFLVRAVASPALFARLWREALGRLRRLRVKAGLEVALDALSWLARPTGAGVLDESVVLALGSGDVAVFPGRPASGRAVVLVESPDGLTPEDANECDPVLVVAVDALAPPVPELLARYIEVVQVRRSQSLAFRAAVKQTARKWRLPAAYCLLGTDPPFYN